MAYVEIWRSGKLVTRRALGAEDTPDGERYVIVIRPGHEVRLAVGEIAAVGEYEARVLGRPTPEAQGSPQLPTTKDFAGKTRPAGEPSGPVSTGAGSTSRAPPPTTEAGRFPTASADGETARPPPHMPQIEGYRVIRKISDRSGQGTVWQAEQLSTSREVALKFLQAGAFSSRIAQIRFHREVELTASLEHPNIARVYDSELRHGVFCYAMELIDGVDLDKYVQQSSLTQSAV